MHPRLMRPNGYTKKELQKLSETQNGIIGSLIDDEGHNRVFIEIVLITEEYREVLLEYDLNRFEVDFHACFRNYVQGFFV